MSCVPTSASISKSIIVSSSSPSLTGRLYTLCGLAANVIFAALSLILNCPGLKLTVAIYRGLPIGCPTTNNTLTTYYKCLNIKAGALPS